ncbi:MAG: polyprenol monophosphomannose synthase [Deltaproteobacteria bacterium]|nr:polyprenol monophosphomannose synthase [Deltaproteobacteria bacterium]
MGSLRSNILIIMPTYNEAENIGVMIDRISALVPGAHMLVVDDNSPDGTAKRVTQLQQSLDNLKLIVREGKQGLASAYLAGFGYALNHGYEYIFEMDADGSHSPESISPLLDAVKNNDLVIGSRYVAGGGIKNWPLSRFLLSYLANKYARVVTGMPVKDATGGFKCFRRRVLEDIDLHTVTSHGYAFQIEVNFRAWKKGFKIAEIPIVFFDRTRGKSKMSKGIILEALWVVWKLRLSGRR